MSSVRSQDEMRVRLDTLDRQLFAQLAEVSETFSAPSCDIWSSDFRPDRMPLVFVRDFGTPRAYGFAMNVDGVRQLDPDCVQVDLPNWSGLGPVFRIGTDAANGFGLAGEMPAQLSCDIAGQECLVLSYVWLEAHASSWEFARFYVHEAFHHFQMFEQVWRVPVGYDPATPWIRDDVDAELVTLEMWCLEAAAVHASGRRSTELASKFLEVRARRYNRRPDLAALEAGHEQIEGSARYVENYYAAANGRTMRLPLPSSSDFGYDEFASNGRFYRTGARAMELMDRTGESWRHLLATGLDPVSILREYLGRGQFSDLIGPSAPANQTIDLRTGSVLSSDGTIDLRLVA